MFPSNCCMKLPLRYYVQSWYTTYAWFFNGNGEASQDPIQFPSLVSPRACNKTAWCETEDSIRCCRIRWQSLPGWASNDIIACFVIIYTLSNFQFTMARFKIRTSQNHPCALAYCYCHSLSHYKCLPTLPCCRQTTIFEN